MEIIVKCMISYKTMINEMNFSGHDYEDFKITVDSYEEALQKIKDEICDSIIDALSEKSKNKVNADSIDLKIFIR